METPPTTTPPPPTPTPQSTTSGGEVKVSHFGAWDITFKSVGHSYSAFNTKTGETASKGIASVTTFIHSMFPKFVGAEVVKKMRARSRFAKYGTMTDDEIVKYWADNGAHAADLGTEMHATMETYLRSVMTLGWPGEVPATPPPPRPWVINPNWPQTLGDPEGTVINLQHLEDFKLYMERKHLMPVAAEKCMFNRKLMIAGTTDAIFRNTETGDFLLYDWKRRSEFTYENPWQTGHDDTPVSHLSDCHYSSALLQLNLYRHMLQEGDGFGNEMMTIKEMHIISIHPSLQTFMDNVIDIDEPLTTEICRYRMSLIKDIQSHEDHAIPPPTKKACLVVL